MKQYILQNQASERLNYRMFDDADKAAWMPFMQATEILHFIGLDPLKTPEENYQQWRDRTVARYENNLGGINMLIDKNTNQVLGASGLLVQEVDGTTELEIGYQLLPEYWHKGYATEATQTIRNYAFQNNFADSIISIIHVDNIASKKVAIRNGMSLEKTTKYKDFPVDVFRISKKDWEKIIS